MTKWHLGVKASQEKRSSRRLGELHMSKSLEHWFAQDSRRGQPRGPTSGLWLAKGAPLAQALI